MKPSTRLGLLYAALGALMSACFLVPWKLASQHAGAEEATLALLGSAALLNTLVALPPGVRGPLPPGGSLGLSLRLALALAVLSLLGNWSSAAAVARVSGALLAVLQRCEVLVVGLLGAVVLGERVRPSFWIGTLLAGVGVVLLSQPSSAGAALGQSELSGALFGLGSAVCFGTMAVLTRRYIVAIQPVVLNALRLWFAVALWFAIERRLPGLSGPLFVYAGLAALFGPFLSRLAIMFSARHVAASTTVLASLLTPVLTLLLGALVLGSWPSPRELLGGAVMLAGVSIPVVALLRAEHAGLRSTSPGQGGNPRPS